MRSCICTDILIHQMCILFSPLGGCSIGDMGLYIGLAAGIAFAVGIITSLLFCCLWYTCRKCCCDKSDYNISAKNGLSNARNTEVELDSKLGWTWTINSCSSYLTQTVFIFSKTGNIDISVINFTAVVHYSIAACDVTGTLHLILHFCCLWYKH